MPTNKNFYSLLDRPATQCSPVGVDIYEWSYLDKVGNLKTDKKNVYEEIQSFKNSVDYKKKIEQGETFDNGTGIYLDTTKFRGDYADFSQYLANLASNLRSQIAQNNGSSASKTASQTATVVKESAINSSASGAVDGQQQSGDGKQQGGDGK